MLKARRPLVITKLNVSLSLFFFPFLLPSKVMQGEFFGSSLGDIRFLFPC